jgi:hypothetical protein
MNKGVAVRVALLVWSSAEACTAPVCSNTRTKPISASETRFSVLTTRTAEAPGFYKACPSGTGTLTSYETCQRGVLDHFLEPFQP